MTDDDLRTRAREAAEAYAPMNKGLVSADTMGERWAYSDGFRAGFLAHAAQQPTREQIEALDTFTFDDPDVDPSELFVPLAAVLALLDGAGS